MTDARDHDVVLFGATGFTGRLTAAHLARRLRGTSVSWAIAGRDPRKLEAVAGDLGEQPPAVEVVDVTDPDGLRKLAGRTRALATTVGPYGEHGEPVVRACVEAGTHYADITGEPAFVRTVRDRHHEAAVAAGVKLVSCCGFDSVPHDLGAWFTVQQLPDDAPLSIRGYVETNARFSGGTLRSAVRAAADRVLPPRRFEGDGRPVARLPQRIHRIDPAARLAGYGVPLPTLDAAIVLRSAQVLDGYGTRFRYGHYARVRRLPTVVTGVASVAAFATLAALPPTRGLVERALPASGEGPSEERRARSWFRITFVGTGGGRQVVTRVSGGDPGYDETARMLGEAVLELAQAGGPQVAGALTPAVALGAPYHRRLVDQGLRFEVLAST